MVNKATVSNNKLPDVRIKRFFGSIKGNDRTENEDNQLIIEDSFCKLFFLFDGVGGSANGKGATICAIDFINRNYQAYFLENDYDTKKLFFDTNSYVLNSGLKDALTTICCLIILLDGKRKFIISNVGDTRAYSFTFQTVRQVSTDDKLSLRSNVITKCIGMRDFKLSDVHKFNIQSDQENFLLCTDGFYSLFEENKLKFLNILNSENDLLISKKINAMVKGRNTDDASYIAIYQ
jgi:serine/threonine protein phosphatase PrpC